MKTSTLAAAALIAALGTLAACEQEPVNETTPPPATAPGGTGSTPNETGMNGTGVDPATGQGGATDPYANPNSGTGAPGAAPGATPPPAGTE